MLLKWELSLTNLNPKPLLMVIFGAAKPWTSLTLSARDAWGWSWFSRFSTESFPSSASLHIMLNRGASLRVAKSWVFDRGDLVVGFGFLSVWPWGRLGFSIRGPRDELGQIAERGQDRWVTIRAPYVKHLMPKSTKSDQNDRSWKSWGFGMWGLFSLSLTCGEIE